MSSKQVVEWFMFPEVSPPKTEWYYTTLKRTETDILKGDKITYFESREYYFLGDNDWTDMEYDITYPIEYNNTKDEIIAWRNDAPYKETDDERYETLAEKAWMYDDLQ